MARILVIDDEPDMRMLLEEILKSVGHEVSSAAGGRDGVEQHRAHPADLIITDLHMPNQEGSETILEVRSRWPEVAIIAMSGTAQANMLPISQKLGAVGYLQKPFAFEELFTAVTRALGGESPPQ